MPSKVANQQSNSNGNVVAASDNSAERCPHCASKKTINYCVQLSDKDSSSELSSNNDSFHVTMKWEVVEQAAAELANAKQEITELVDAELEAVELTAVEREALEWEAAKQEITELVAT